MTCFSHHRWPVSWLVAYVIAVKEQPKQKGVRNGRRPRLVKLELWCASPLAGLVR
ncbi:hypothetical protein ACRALDRAFT_1059533 [Sodiomyces alcalophilus JCM 7366]|uniref:uncharacterized protein n=1 Tax=Sodiomyces alcalophilus JCM 7366 TaxID=591952 RepID=UPI0039B650CC